MQKRVRLLLSVIFTVAAAATSATLLPGCRHSFQPSAGQPQSAQTTGVHVYGGIDGSGGVRPQRLGASVILCARLGGRLDRNRDWLTLYSVDSQTQEFYDAPPPVSSSALQLVIIKEMRRLPKQPRTLPAKFWTEVARRGANKGGPVVICFWTDGDNDSLTARSAAEIRVAAGQLARNPRVKGVFIFGANKENWAMLRTCFGALDNRLHLSTASHMNIDSVTSTIEQARTQTNISR